MRKLSLTLSLSLLLSTLACVQPTTNQTATNAAPAGGDAAFKTAQDAYVREFLHRFPVVNTYLGGGGLDPSLREVEGQLRDHSAAALESEDRWLADEQKKFESIDAVQLSPASRIDREVALAQIKFLLRQHQSRRYQERALDTYVDEPFRAIDWQLQGMAQTGDRSYGTPEEWSLVVKRLQAVPRFMRVAQEQLAAGIKSGNTPDWRMLRRNGLDAAEADAKYFEKTISDTAAERVAPGPQRDELLKQIADAGKAAAAAYRGLRDFVAREFFDDAAKPGVDGLKSQFRADRFSMGEDEYNWALRNNLRITDKTAAQLYEESMPVAEATRQEMIKLAGEIAAGRKITAPTGEETVRAVFDELGKDYPKTDAEMVKWYEEAARRLVDYGRKSGVFDVPADYKLDVVETPPPLRAAIEGAAYYPAPPFKQTGTGRFYVTTSGNNDQGILKENNRAALADLSAHEGFPGHDWHYKMMTKFRDQIGAVRWLTPGEVEGSSSMWEDSIAAEGYALYSEALMAEPQPGFPAGFYTPEEHLYQLKGKLYRDLRVRIDTGLHTGRLSYDAAVDLFSQVVDFLPGSCRDADAVKVEAKRASCSGAEGAVFRYSKWPTQAITYRLGKEQIYALRSDAQRLLGDRFSAKDFHLLFMQQGTIPTGYFRDELLRKIQEKK
ncbi:MAG TPA: DUF885 domain-containing protein [Pyrinomonadaceae bacterium]|jgi:uncharacterized protein (DUF885 family)|nr:DUF885 domain-containing protein [Pyrinomonadaceae bacterium]